MFKRSLLALAFASWASLASAQTCPTRPTGDNSNACASTAFVASAITVSKLLAPGHVFVGNSGGVATDVALSGDCTMAVTGAITCTKTNGVTFTSLATHDLSGDCTNILGAIVCTKTNGVAFGSFATGTSAANLTGRIPALANLPVALANSKLLGSGAAGIGISYAELTLGTNLSMSGTTLNASGGTTLPSGFSSSAAIADGQFITNGSITSGTSTLASASNPFVVGDVGKTISCGATGAAGVLQSGTISAFTNSSTITVSFTAGATTAVAVCQWGTDNTTTINSEIAALTKGGTLLLPAGYIMVSSINITNTISMGLQGASCGINGSGFGSVLVPTTASSNRPVIDLVGAQGPTIKCLQIGTTRSPVAAGAGILAAGSNSAATTLVYLDQVFITNTFQQSSLFFYGAQDSFVGNSSIWNYNQTLYGNASGAVAIKITTDNSGMGSNYATIATGNQPAGNVTLLRVEAHDYKPAGGTTSGAALNLKGAGKVKVIGGQYDSSSTVGIVVFEQSTAGTSVDQFQSYGGFYYNENGTNSAACLNTASGSTTNVTLTGFSCTATAQRTGTVSYLGFSVP